MLDLLNLKFSQDLKLEMGKALFNLGNFFIVTPVLTQITNGSIDLNLIALGIICFIMLYGIAMVLINTK